MGNVSWVKVECRGGLRIRVNEVGGGERGGWKLGRDDICTKTKKVEEIKSQDLKKYAPWVCTVQLWGEVN